MREDRHAVCVGLYNTSYTPIPFASVRPMFRACVRGEKGDMPFVLFFAAHPTLEVPFVSEWLMLSACVKNEREEMPFVLIFATHPTLEVSSFRLPRNQERGVGKRSNTINVIEIQTKD